MTRSARRCWLDECVHIRTWTREADTQKRCIAACDAELGRRRYFLVWTDCAGTLPPLGRPPDARAYGRPPERFVRGCPRSSPRGATGRRSRGAFWPAGCSDVCPAGANSRPPTGTNTPIVIQATFVTSDEAQDPGGQCTSRDDGADQPRMERGVAVRRSVRNPISRRWPRAQELGRWSPTRCTAPPIAPRAAASASIRRCVRGQGVPRPMTRHDRPLPQALAYDASGDPRGAAGSRCRPGRGRYQ